MPTTCPKCENRLRGPHPSFCTPTDRFWNQVRKTEGCWEWLGYVNGDGYGSMSLNNRPVTAHRFSWQLAFGEAPRGMCVCHRCDNRICVRPDHLFVGTNADNMRDRAVKNRPANPNDGKTHCIRGHEFTAENTRYYGDGYRQCIACVNMRNKARGPL